MMSTPKVTVVLPVYNAEAHLAAAVESVLGQTFADLEVLAVNDGSTDGSRDVLARYAAADPRVRVIDQPNRGLIEVLNRGVREARGAWVARMDADDVCLPRRLERQMAHLAAHPEIALLGGWVATIDEDGRLLADVVPFPVTHDELWASIGRRPWVMCHPAVVFRRDAGIDVGLYDPAYKHAEDAEFFARLMTKYKAATLPEVVLKYRLRRGAVSGQFKDHGRVNAALVGKLVERWRPGDPLAATAEERAAADTEIAAGAKAVGPNDAASTYHCRCGRELLRGARWGRAMAAYAKAAAGTPMRLEAYKGLAAAALRAGAAHPDLRRAAAAVL
jgi:glycosyltransferase involved in cell wall biosynthesis